MRRITVIASIVALLATAGAAHAIGPFGPPGPAFAADAYNSLEAGYFLYRSKWESSFNEVGVKDFDSIEFEQTHGFLQSVIYPIRDGDVFLRVGAADFRETTTDGSFASGARPFGSVGIRGAFYSVPSRQFFVGAVAQASLYASYSDSRRLALAPAGEAKADIHSYFDLALGVGAEKIFADRLTVYGGPFLFYSQAQGHVSSPALGRDFKTQFKDKNNLGVFAGARLVIWRGLSADGEVQAKGNASYGFKLSYAF